ncbi:MAG TPA: hypothetical protein ENG70_02145 [Candidatus Cloacimonetes bacterium]|nr:hypothetical protein [Candidatus Cloacimonadota bacterium]HEX37646.1 hypothetical protein [Candidatus Cloacimonadota bacterium]
MHSSFNENRTIETKKELKLLLTSENVGFIVEGHDEETTNLEAEFEIKGELSDDFTLEEILEVAYNKKKNELTIKVSEPNEGRIKKARIELLVPHKTMVASNLSNGSVRLEYLEGMHELESHNGSIKIVNNKGACQCDTRNGSIKIENTEGDLQLKTKNGSINLRNCNGMMDVKGENGSCKLIDCKGSLELQIDNGPIRVIEGGFESADVKNKNGSMYYEFYRVEKGTFSFKNKNGKILLIIPDEMDIDIKAKNMLGNFRVGIKGEYDRKKDDDTQILEMIRGSGNVKIEIKNQNGSIQLMKDPLQKDVQFNLSELGENLEHIFEEIPFEEGMEKAKEALKNVKHHFKNMQFDFSKNFEKMMNNIEVNKEKIKAKIDSEIKDKKRAEEIRNTFKETFESLKEAFYKKKQEKEEASQSKEEMSQSRLKILELLEKGTITPDEAERLLNAIGEENE